MASSTFSQPNATTFTPEEIVSAVLAGRVRVPSFQREFRWQWQDVKLLFDSISKGYPIGNVLLWEREAEKCRIQLGALEIDAPQGVALYVVDGQQRVTSLANVLSPKGANDPRFSLVFNLENEDFQKPEPGEPPHLIPLHIIFDLQKLLGWFAKHPAPIEWFERATRLAKAIRQYAIPAYVVKQNDETVLRDIFDRINNSGRRLNRWEVFAGLHGTADPRAGAVPFSDIAERVDAETRFGRIDDDTALKAILARRGIDIMRDVRAEFKEYDQQSDFPGEDPAVAYEEGTRALLEAVRFVQHEACIPHLGFMPYRHLLIILTRFFALNPNPSQRNRVLLRRFLWRTTLASLDVHQNNNFETKTLLGHIRQGDESRSVQQLLEALSNQQLQLPSLDRFHAKSRETRAILCAFWSLRPMSPVYGTIYDLEAIGATLLDQTNASNVCKRFTKSARTPMRLWAANRAILLGEVDEVANGTINAFLDCRHKFDNDTHARIFESHALNEIMLQALEQKRWEDFLTSRQKRLKEVQRDFLESMTETKFEDTPPLDEFDMDEDERDDEVNS